MRKKRPEPWLGRLLDAWSPPQDAGEALAIAATSYTFDSVFFEEQCLARFAGIRSLGGDDDEACEYIVEREEKLSQVKAVVLVDKDHCRGQRNPRWDLLCARDERGCILHAKLSLLLWARRMRLIVASANLTEPGYRRNREVFSCIEACEDEPLAVSAFEEALSFMSRLGSLAGDRDNPALERWYGVVEEAKSRLSRLRLAASGDPLPVSFIGVRPEGPTLFEAMADAWDRRQGVPRAISIVSPFFDQDDGGAEKVADALWDLGARTGSLALSVYAPAEKGGSVDHAVRLRAPAVLKRLPRPGCSLEAMAVFERVNEERRPLHAKAVALWSEGAVLLYTGSSNMTCSGTGLGRTVNYEAGLCVLSSDPKARSAIGELWGSFDAEAVLDPSFEGSAEDEADSDDRALSPLPAAFRYAVFRRVGDDSRIEIAIVPGPSLPTDWALRCPEGEDFAEAAGWLIAGRPRLYAVPCLGPKVPSGLELHWSDRDEARVAWLPVCVSGMRDLPPPEELRSLSLEVLIEVLSSARPLSHIVAAYRKARAGEVHGGEIEHDSLKRVDTSGFLIQRARRASLVMSRLADRLVEPCPSIEAFEWRLRGPCGVRAVEEALEKVARSDAEKQFYKVELYIELMRAKSTATHRDCLDREWQRNKIRAFVLERIAELEQRSLDGLGDAMAGYIRLAIDRIRELP
jgi:hypothetical protein